MSVGGLKRHHRGLLRGLFKALEPTEARRAYTEEGHFSTRSCKN